jgi:hypothetical protein
MKSAETVGRVSIKIYHGRHKQASPPSVALSLLNSEFPVNETIFHRYCYMTPESRNSGARIEVHCYATTR